MDTALALMEAKEPVYPLDIVQAMRDQRASMVQNVVSTHFVQFSVNMFLSNLPSSRVNTSSCASASWRLTTNRSMKKKQNRHIRQLA